MVQASAQEGQGTCCRCDAGVERAYCGPPVIFCDEPILNQAKGLQLAWGREGGQWIAGHLQLPTLKGARAPLAAFGE